MIKSEKKFLRNQVKIDSDFYSESSENDFKTAKFKEKHVCLMGKFGKKRTFKRLYNIIRF